MNFAQKKCRGRTTLPLRQPRLQYGDTPRLAEAYNAGRIQLLPGIGETS